VIKVIIEILIDPARFLLERSLRIRFYDPHKGRSVTVPEVMRTLIYLTTQPDGQYALWHVGLIRRRRAMLRFIAVVGFVLSVATSAQAMTPAPLPPPNDMMTQVAVGCGPGRTRVNGVCVARTTVRQTRRAVRRCVRWQAGACALYE
jgi:hypothetical protein